MEVAHPTGRTPPPRLWPSAPHSQTRSRRIFKATGPAYPRYAQLAVVNSEFAAQRGGPSLSLSRTPYHRACHRAALSHRGVET